jgi:hypothetical protein
MANLATDVDRREKGQDIGGILERFKAPEDVLRRKLFLVSLV